MGGFVCKTYQLTECVSRHKSKNRGLWLQCGIEQVEEKVSQVEEKVSQVEEKMMSELGDIKELLRKLSNTT